MKHDNWKQLARMLYYSVRLPIRLYFENAELLAMPDTSDPVLSLLSCGGAPSEWPVPDRQFAVQYIIGRTGERYICSLSPSYSVCIGPFRMDSLQDKELNRHLRIYFSSVKNRESVRSCILSLKRLSEDSFFYTGQLLQFLIDQHVHSEDSTGSSLAAFPAPSTDELYRHPPFFMEREIVQCIAEQDEKNALATLGEINRLHRASLSDDPLRSLKNSLICSCSLFARAAIAGGAMPDAAFSHSDACIRTIEEFDDIGSLADYEYTMIRQFVNLVRQRREGGVSAVIRAAIIYANEHLLEPLSVKKIAESIYVNPSYLSSSFKQEIGESLSHYIRRKRIRHAEKLLHEGQDTMADIAATCQFCSQSHFIQAFKKMKGLTPEQYRRMEGAAYRQSFSGKRTNLPLEESDENHTHRSQPQ